MRFLYYSLILLLLPFFCSYAQSFQNVIINEFVSSNSESLLDEDGDSSDWIELYNPLSVDVNLSGWSLSDSESNIQKWIFPNYVIKSGEYLLVWASSKDRRPVQGSLSQGIKREVFSDIGGTKIVDLINSINYPSSPSYTEIISDLFEAPVDVGDHYGQRMHGLLKAPATGNYTFWISSDDNGELHLSSDESSDNARVIASVDEWTNSREWYKYDSQRSANIYLEKDKYYYISALMKEAEGGDNLAVGWELPNGSVEMPMSASHIYNYTGQLHTNFSISSDGEPLLLSDPHGNIVHQVPEVSLPSDISYGINPSNLSFCYFKEPTPGEENSTECFSEILNSTVEFSHEQGFYTSDIYLSLTSSEPNVKIYYTLDGSDPRIDALNGLGYSYKNQYPDGQLSTNYTKTFLYEGPIEISDRTSDDNKLGMINPQYNTSPPWFGSKYFKGTVVRAIAVKEGALTLTSSTKTYFITPEGRSKYSLPIISVVSDEKGLFDYHEGIYVPGKIADNHNGHHDGGTPANYHQRGISWERPGHIEYFGTTADDIFGHSVGIRMHGGWSRARPRKSMRLYSRSRYGSGDRMEYEFFENNKAHGNPEHYITSYKRILLRNSGNDAHETLYRDALMTSLVKESPFVIMAYKPIIHFINGEYWGIMNLRERYDRYYFENHYGVAPESVAILDQFGNVVEGNSNDRNDFFEILNFAEQNNMELSNNYNWIKSKIDVDNLASYFAAQFYFLNEDWPGNNLKFWRYRDGEYSENAGRGLDGRWGWMLYDTDFGMGMGDDSKVSRDRLSYVLNPSGARDPSSRLFRELINNDEFMHLFVNYAMDQINSSFKHAHIDKTVDKFNAQISAERAEHYQRWNNGNDLGGSIKRFGKDRSEYVIRYMKNAFRLSDDINVVLSREGDGLIRINSIIIDRNLPGVVNENNPYPWKGSYYKNVPLEISAIDTPGSRFSHWEGVSNLIKYDRSILITPTEALSIKAIFVEESLKPIHYWHFNNLSKGELHEVFADLSSQETPGMLYYSGTGAGYMDRVKEGTSINVFDDYIDGNALRVRNPSNERYLYFRIPTTNFEDIKFSYAVTRTSNGSEKQKISYKTEANGSWQPLQEVIVTENYQLIEIDLSDKKDVSDNDNLMIRIEFIGKSANNESGNNRFDNILVSGFADSIGINGIDADKGISIFPNPASDYTEVISESRILKVEIADIKGSVLIKGQSGGFYERINVSSLQNGLYIINIVTEKGIITKKLMIK